MKKIFLSLYLFGSIVTAFAQVATVKTSDPALADGGMIAISFAPIVLFILVILILFWKLNNESYKIGDALKENETINVSENNPLLETPKPVQPALDGVTPPADTLPPTASATPFVSRTIQPKSSSRLISFISGVSAVSIAACCTSFWFYRNFQGETNVNLSGLTNVLLALGIGVIPYAVNKISTAASDK